MASSGKAFRRNLAVPPVIGRFGPAGWETNVVLFGVQLAQLLTVLLAAACVLLCLLALVATFRHPTRRPVLQRVGSRRTVRRGVGRHLSGDLTPLLSRDPPGFPPLRPGDEQAPPWRARL
jgi:hypothetical protein